MRIGYSTGSCAAAAATAATKMLASGLEVSNITIILPDGEEVVLAIEEVNISKEEVSCCVLKDGGSDPDITNGTPICVNVKWISGEGNIVIKGGKGVGRVNKPGLKVPLGEAAINPVPREMISKNVKEVLPIGKSVEVTVYVPQGEELAKKTMNKKLGIEGGISILGTTGRVRPMSNEAFKDSLLVQLDVAKAEGLDYLFLVPGASGERILREDYAIPEIAICQMSNWVGFILEHVVSKGFKGVILAGHLGKIGKIAGGIFNTHSKVADGRLEIIAAYAGALGASQSTIKELLEQTTTEAALKILIDNNLEETLFVIAQRVEIRVREFTGGLLDIGVLIFDSDHQLLAWDEGAKRIGRSNGWWLN